MDCESMLFVTNHIPYLWGLSNSFSNSLIDFYSCEVVSSSDMRTEQSIKLWPLCIHNGSCFESLNVLHVSSCKMFTFCGILHEARQKMQTNSREHAARTGNFPLLCSYEESLKGYSFDQFHKLLERITKFIHALLMAILDNPNAHTVFINLEMFS